MENKELLEYLKYAKENKCSLKIMGISGKYSNVLVDYYTDDKMVGRFCRNLEAMSFKFENIVSCCFAESEIQQKFLKKQHGEALYGEQAEEIEAFLDVYKCYYQQIIQKKKDSDKSSETGTFLNDDKNSLKVRALERFDKIFESTYLHPESLLFQYFSGNLSEEEEKTKKQPILLFSRSNFSQKQAIENALEQKVSVIEGPPGTGKTTTILSIVLNLLVNGKKVVVVSKNNSAIDNIKEELDKFQLPPFYLRLGQRKEIIEKQVNPNLKSLVQEAINYGKWNEQVYTASEELQELYLKLKSMEADINQLVIKKNRLQEAENMLRHIEKRREAFQIEKEFEGGKRFQNRSINSMRREIDRIARALQQLDYKGRYSIWNRVKNSFIWKMNKKQFESEGLLLQFQLEYLYLIQEIMTLSKDLEAAELEKKQRELKMLYDTKYIGLSLQVLERFLHYFFANEEYRCLANQIICCEEPDIYRKHKDGICKLYPVILTTADALVYNFNDYIDNDRKIDYIIMDEASQCDLLTGIPVLHLAKRCVIVGDQKQLSAITGEEISGLPEVKDAYRYFSQNLLSSIQKVWQPATVLLREHYRCDYSIINYCNKFFYDNELIIYTEANSNAMGILRVEQGKYARPSLCNEGRLFQLKVLREKS